MSKAPDDPIATFYRRHPYPPPTDDLDAYAAGWRDPQRRRVEYHRLWPTRAYRSDLRVLVAGCGTAQAAKYAMRLPGATVLGIDVSEAGIDATDRLIERHQLTNVAVRRLPIEEVAELGQTFDLVVCTGVLHHLADPELGLRALREVLDPDGAMQLMVYGRYGRLGVTMIQEYGRRLGIEATPSDIAELVATLRELPTHHPMSPLLRGTKDFQDDDALADALLNPRERSYSVPELVTMIEASGLRLGKWLHQAPYLPQCGALSETPHAARIARLEPAEQYAAVELFRGTITRHSAILHRDDGPWSSPSAGADGPITWEGTAWRRWVPLRPVTAVAVEERLPPGVAAVLLNRAHVHPDLVMMVDAAERAAFDAVDGQRTMDDICARTGVGVELFRRLWHHDLIVLDASGAPLA